MLPILYSYRRCPYAIRARMALKYAGIEVQHREIELRNKPESMLMASPKGTVPVLIIGDVVLDQSIEIMRWALQKSDPDNWGGIDEDAAQIWIERNDVAFKTLLDQYKYSNRNPHLNQGEILDTAIALMLKPMNDALEARQYLLGNQQSWVDVAIFPFVRQFSMVNRDWFDQLPFPALKRWLANYLQSELFNAVMHKHPTWTV
ncbi:MAG: glutathione S-transferase [Burkholderiaceae bacterium]